VGKLPRITAAEVISAIERAGFSLARQSGSHKIYKNQAGKRVIRYSLPVETEVNLKVLNTAGRVVRILVNGKQKPGNYNFTWNLKGVSQSQLPNGVYFYRLEAGECKATKKMVMLR
jgi:predicted RNA binding protein YcfA (HicA-like mRNA interferase family)